MKPPLFHRRCLPVRAAWLAGLAWLTGGWPGPGVLHAQSQIHIAALPAYAGRPNAVVTLPLTLDHAAGVAGVALQVNFDPELLSFEAAQAGPLGAKFQLAARAETGVLRLTFARSVALVSGSGRLALLQFRINAGAQAGMASDLPVASLRLSNDAGVDLSWSRAVRGQNGRVTVTTSTFIDNGIGGIPDDWEEQHGLDPFASTPPPRPVNDGRDLLLDFALGLPPNAPDNRGQGVGTEMRREGGTQQPAFSFRQRPDVSGVTYEVQMSGDGRNWAAAGSALNLAERRSVDTGVEQVTYRPSAPPTPGSPQFYRVVVNGTSATETYVAAATPLAGATDSGRPRLTFLSLQMVQPAIYVGTVSTVGPQSISDASATWLNHQFDGAAGACYAAFSGGERLDIADTRAASKSLVFTTAVPGSIAPGTSYRVHRHSTIATIFGPNNEAGLLPGRNLEEADNLILHFPETQQTLTFFYYPGATGPAGWYRSDYQPGGDTIIRPEQGVMVRRRGVGEVTLQTAGLVREGAVQSPVQPGYNLVGTLQASGPQRISQLNLYTGDPARGMVAGYNPVAGDTLHVVQDDGSIRTYFYSNNPGYQGWYDVAYNPAGDVAIPPGAGFFIRRLNEHGEFIWTLPAE